MAIKQARIFSLGRSGSCTMKAFLLSLPLLLLPLTAQAAEETADVLGLRWGMTADEVSEVMELSQGDSNSGYYEAEDIMIGDRPFDVIIQIPIGKGLQKVLLWGHTENGQNIPQFAEFENIVKALDAKYTQIRPKTSVTDGGTMGNMYAATWELPRSILEVSLRGSSLTIRYEARPGYETLSRL